MLFISMFGFLFVLIHCSLAYDLSHGSWQTLHFALSYLLTCLTWLHSLLFYEIKDCCVHFLLSCNKSFKNNHILCLVYVLSICLSILLKKKLVTTYAKKILILKMWYTCSHWRLSNDTIIVTLPFQNSLDEYLFIFSFFHFNPTISNFKKNSNILKTYLKKISIILQIGTYVII